MKWNLRTRPGLALVFILLPFLLYLIWPNNQDVLGKFPKERNVRVMLPEAREKQKIRFDYYDPQTNIKLRSVATYLDQSEEEIIYRPDGSASESTQHYVGESGKILKAHARYAANGITFVFHEVYRPDGTLERKGERLSSGMYQQQYFFEDGKNLYLDRHFNKKGRFQSQKRYRPDTRLESTTLVDPVDTSHSTTFYAADGTTPRAFYREHPSQGEAGEVYAADGKTVLAGFERSNWAGKEQYFDDKGVLIQIREINNGTLKVKGLTTTGSFYQQIWYQPVVIGNEDSHKRLRKVEEYKKGFKDLIRTIAMLKDGSRPAKVIYPTAKGTTVKLLSEDGYITDIELRDKSNKLLSTRNVSAKKEKEPIPDYFFKRERPMELPSSKDLLGPPLYYDYP
jgi:hypothetical protein